VTTGDENDDGAYMALLQRKSQTCQGSETKMLDTDSFFLFYAPLFYFFFWLTSFLFSIFMLSPRGSGERCDC